MNTSRYNDRRKGGEVNGQMMSIDSARKAIEDHGGAKKDTTPRARIPLTETTWEIKDWKKLYERAELRDGRVIEWKYVPIQIRLNGGGYKRLMRTPKGREVFGIFIAMCELAANMRPRRGVLADENGPLSLEDMSLKLSLPEKAIRAAIEVLSAPPICWLIAADGCSINSGTLDGEQPKAALAHAGARLSLSDLVPVGSVLGGVGEPAMPPALAVSAEFVEAWTAYVRHRAELGERALGPSAVQAQWARLLSWGLERAVAALRHTVAMGWKNIRESDDAHSSGRGGVGAGARGAGSASGIERGIAAQRERDALVGGAKPELPDA